MKVVLALALSNKVYEFNFVQVLNNSIQSDGVPPPLMLSVAMTSNVKSAQQIFLGFHVFLSSVHLRA